MNQPLKIYLLLFCCFTFDTLVSFGQVNLVSNPSFENFTSCPVSEDELYKAADWFACSASPDYFNSCDMSNYVSVPDNAWGYQFAGSGNAYGGFFSRVSTTIASPNYREYLGVNLLSSLSIGIKYFISFKTSPAFDSIEKVNCATNKIGINFSVDSCYNPGLVTPSNNAIIFTNTIQYDTINWVRLTGSFVADSAYNFIIIGNFFDDNNTDTLILDGSLICNSSYYYIDDVCVSTDSLYANQYVYTSIAENKIENGIKIYPNPCTDYCYVDNNLFEVYNLKISTLQGKEIKFIKNIKDKLLKIDLSNIEAPFLIINIEANQQFYNYKLLKQ